MKLVLVFLLVVPACFAQAPLDGLLEELKNPDFEVREKATEALSKSAMTIDAVKKLLNETADPEVKKRLSRVLELKIDLTGWVKLKDDEITKRAKAAGRESNGSILYLVKASDDGGDYIGKYLLEWGGACFPVGKSEKLINEFRVWVGEGKWQVAEKGMAKAIPCGKTKEGKMIYAVRAQMQGGVHPGMLIEGEAKARISYGGAVVRVEKYEVLGGH